MVSVNITRLVKENLDNESMIEEINLTVNPREDNHFHFIDLISQLSIENNSSIEALTFDNKICWCLPEKVDVFKVFSPYYICNPIPEDIFNRICNGRIMVISTRNIIFDKYRFVILSEESYQQDDIELPEEDISEEQLLDTLRTVIGAIYGSYVVYKDDAHLLSRSIEASTEYEGQETKSIDLKILEQQNSLSQCYFSVAVRWFQFLNPDSSFLLKYVRTILSSAEETLLNAVLPRAQQRRLPELMARLFVRDHSLALSTNGQTINDMLFLKPKSFGHYNYPYVENDVKTNEKSLVNANKKFTQLCQNESYIEGRRLSDLFNPYSGLSTTFDRMPLEYNFPILIPKLGQQSIAQQLVAQDQESPKQDEQLTTQENITHNIGTSQKILNRLNKIPYIQDLSIYGCIAAGGSLYSDNRLDIYIYGTNVKSRINTILCLIEKLEKHKGSYMHYVDNSYLEIIWDTLVTQASFESLGQSQQNFSIRIYPTNAVLPYSVICSFGMSHLQIGYDFYTKNFVSTPENHYFQRLGCSSVCDAEITEQDLIECLEMGYNITMNMPRFKLLPNKFIINSTAYCQIVRKENCYSLIYKDEEDEMSTSIELGSAATEKSRYVITKDEIKGKIMFNRSLKDSDTPNHINNYLSLPEKVLVSHIVFNDDETISFDLFCGKASKCKISNTDFVNKQTTKEFYVTSLNQLKELIRRISGLPLSVRVRMAYCYDGNKLIYNDTDYSWSFRNPFAKREFVMNAVIKFCETEDGAYVEILKLRRTPYLINHYENLKGITAAPF